MKRCTKCGIKRDENEFYKSKSNVDGLHNSCKICWKLRRKEKYIEKREQVRIQCRKYYLANQEELKKRSRLYQKKERTQKTREYREKNPEKYKARYAVSNALAKGKISKDEICTICKTECKLQAHHEDYSKPLDVIWVCVDCHAKIHTIHTNVTI
jgi:hypothetical protein